MSPDTYFSGVIIWAFIFGVLLFFAAMNYDLSRLGYEKERKQAQKILRLAVLMFALSIFWPLGIGVLIGAGLFFLGKSIKTLGGWLVE